MYKKKSGALVRVERHISLSLTFYAKRETLLAPNTAWLKHVVAVASSADISPIREYSFRLFMV
jgi:hypothetical protein